MGSVPMYVLVPFGVLTLFLAGLACACAYKSGTDVGRAAICAEINWESPTCKQEKERRLQP